MTVFFFEENSALNITECTTNNKDHAKINLMHEKSVGPMQAILHMLQRGTSVNA